jgi:DNA-binding transcriptional LysR family regulator
MHQHLHGIVVGVNGPLIIDDMDMTIRAAMDGIGLAFSLEDYVAPHLASGALVRVLEDWCPPFAGFLPLLPESAAAAGRALGSHQRASPVERTVRDPSVIAEHQEV